MALISKVINEAFIILKSDEDIAEKDLSSKIIQKFKKDEDDKKEKEKNKKPIHDLQTDKYKDVEHNYETTKDKKPPQEVKENKKKESSINIMDNYKKTLFYRLERIANLSEDKLVKAEIDNIAQDIKQLL